jgi:glycosyltransferase involved in cell wall biosynthesis
VLAASSRSAAERFADDCSAGGAVIFDRYDLAHNPVEFLRACRARGTEHVVVHTVDWSRETAPQLYALALVAAAGRKVWLVDEQAGTITRVPARRSAGRAAVAPILVGTALAPGLLDMARFLRRPARTGNSAKPRVTAEIGPVIAIWSGGDDATVGGSVTHISGVLRGFRRSGFRVGLVASAPPPEQVANVVDTVAVVSPPPGGARVSPELAAMVANRAVVTAARELALRIGTPAMIYQRHAALRTAGVELSHLWNAPLVLEWNASEAWAFANWSHGAKPMRTATHRLIAAVERRVAYSADVVAAVSANAADTALAAGATADRTVTIPNAVDIEQVDAALREGPADRSGRWVGWIGSFGSWHGAEVLVRSISRLPADVRLLMIGDGRERAECLRLADELGVGERIVWPGRQAHDDALRLLAGCDLLAAPHVPLEGGEPFFGSPTKLFEYMALQKPIVASRLGQIAEVLEHERTALLVEPGDDVELASAIASLLADPEQGRRLADAARTAVETHHTWDQRAAAILAALDPS